jgi:hypothetical protein
MTTSVKALFHFLVHDFLVRAAGTGGTHPAILPCPVAEARRTLPSVTPQSRERTTAPAAYAERLGLSWWAWPIALVVDLILGFEVSLGFAGLPPWLPSAVLLPLTLVVLLRAGRIRVAVTADEFLVDDARLPVAVICDVVAPPASGKRSAWARIRSPS